MLLNERQEKIIEIVKSNTPITGEEIAKKLDLTRGTLRPDLAILTMSGILEARPKVGYFYSGKTPLSFLAEQVNTITVKEAKSMPIVLEETTSLYDAIVTMMLEDVGTVFAIDEGYLSGVISRKDLLKSAIGGTDLNKLPIGVIMTRMPNIITARDDETALSAAIKLIEHEIDSIPVVEIEDEENKKYKVIGRISKTNITRLFAELGNHN